MYVRMTSKQKKKKKCVKKAKILGNSFCFAKKYSKIRRAKLRKISNFTAKIQEKN